MRFSSVDGEHEFQTGLSQITFDTTAAYRAMNEANCNPLTPEEMAKSIMALRKQENRDLEMTVLLCYEAGLRLGEAFGLQWGDVWWGEDDSDTTRRIHILTLHGKVDGPAEIGTPSVAIVTTPRDERSRPVTLQSSRVNPTFIVTCQWAMI